MREILGVLVPFFAIVALGYGAARFRLIWQSGLNGLNAYLFNLYLFASRYLRDVGVFSAAILSSTVISVATLAFVVWLLAQPSSS